VACSVVPNQLLICSAILRIHQRPALQANRRPIRTKSKVFRRIPKPGSGSCLEGWEGGWRGNAGCLAEENEEMKILEGEVWDGGMRSIDSHL